MPRIDHKPKFHYSTIFIRTLLMAISILCISGLAMAQADSILQERFSLDLQDRTLTEVFQTLSRESCLEIIYSQELGNQRVHLKLQDVTIEKVLQTVLARKNHTIVYDRSGVIQIDVYGESAPASGGASVSMVHPVSRRSPAVSARSSQHSGLKLKGGESIRNIGKSYDRYGMTEEEAKILDQRATINPDTSVQEKSEPAKSFFNLLSGAQKPKTAETPIIK